MIFSSIITGFVNVKVAQTQSIKPPIIYTGINDSILLVPLKAINT